MLIQKFCEKLAILSPEDVVAGGGQKSGLFGEWTL